MWEANNFLKRRDGNFAVVTALMAPVLIGFAGMAVDYSLAVRAKSSLQDAADAAALAVAVKSEGDLSGPASQSLGDYGQKFFHANTEHGAAVVTVSLDPTRSVVAVGAELDQDLNFPIFQSSWNIDSYAEAEVRTKSSVCLLALATSGTAFSLSGSASLTAPNCKAHANSTSSNAYVTSGAAKGSALSFCTAGTTGSGSFSPPPTTSCPPLIDPFADLKFPSISAACGTQTGHFGGGYANAWPGVYCSGLSFGGTAKVTLSPGVYVIRDSQLTVGKNARLTGSGVTIILQGSASFSFEAGSDVNLKAPTTGDFAGVVIAQDKANSIAGESRVHGGGNVELTGTIYLPRQTMTVSGGGNLGVTAAQTAIVAERFVFSGNGTATLNMKMNSDFKTAGFSPKALGGGVVTRLVK